MNSTITQALAALLLLLSAMKLVTLALRPRAWFKLVRRMYRHPQRTSGVALACAALVLWLLVRSGLDIVQILAVGFFMALMMMAGLAPYVPRLLEWMEFRDLGQLTRQQGLYVLVWTILLLWGVAELVG